MSKQKQITFNEARRMVQSMCLINGFLFDSVTENNEDAKYVVKTILSRVLGKTISDIEVTPQKTYNGLDTKYHGIRFDAHIIPSVHSEELAATVYDLEIEDRLADREDLPRRQRYYSAMSDAKTLPSGADYSDLPDYISVTISSYDPFMQGDMYYEAKTVLTSHPQCDYDDGITNIFLYASGRLNISDNEHGKKLQQLLQYMVTGQKPSVTDREIEHLDNLVSKTKEKAEVTKDYMKQWDRERIIKKEAMREAQLDAAIQFIEFGRELGTDDATIRDSISKRFRFSAATIDELFEKVNAAVIK